MLNGFTFWHVLILLVVAAIVIGVVLLIVKLVRAGSRVASASARVPSSSSARTRLEQLEELRAAGAIGEDEYSTKRAEILRDL